MRRMWAQGDGVDMSNMRSIDTWVRTILTCSASQATQDWVCTINKEIHSRLNGLPMRLAGSSSLTSERIVESSAAASAVTLASTDCSAHASPDAKFCAADTGQSVDTSGGRCFAYGLCTNMP